MITRRTFLASSLAATSTLGGPPRVWAQTVSGTTRVVVGFPAGGSADVVARLLAGAMEGYAATTIVENKPGAGGRSALEELKASPPDGSTMALTPAGMVTLFPHVYKKLGYDPLVNLTPVSPVCKFGFVIAVGPKVPATVRTLGDLIAWCKANPAQASYGTPGLGSLSHFTTDAIARATGAPLVHVSYRGGPAALQDVVGGQIPFATVPLTSALPLIQGGQVRAVVVTSPVRHAALLDTQTIQEAGFADLEATEWFGVFLPGRAPEAIVRDLHARLSRALKSTVVRDGFAKQSLDVFEASQTDFRRLIQTESVRWGNLVRASGFQPLD